MSTVQPGGLILVSGANGYIGSAIVRVLLDYGYSVRGSVRSVSDNHWMISHFGPKFHLVEIPDVNIAGAFEDAIRGVQGIVHVAADTSMAANKSIVTKTVQGTIGLLEAAAKENCVKRVVLTSSQGACVSATPGQPYKINKDTYNDHAVEMVLGRSDPDPDQEAVHSNPLQRGAIMYQAAKTMSDKKAFEWIHDHKPPFVFNCVVPNLNLGGVELVERLGLQSSSAAIDGLAYGNSLGAQFFPSQWFVNVKDTALLHIAALTMEEVKSERILAFSASFSWRGIIDILQRRYPNRTFATVDESAVDLGEVDNSLGIQLLKRLGRRGFRNLEETVVENMEAVIQAESMPQPPKSRLEVVMETMMATDNTVEKESL
ncbi:hypothetical protein CFAM422_005883 [Trichoderma lentiforme]|uniref:NAD-dependent epimerase/dehydratase domain-containing protein n=1 Tax=Trichoderma lentiforme TaxID=1567552 RepID=A0A9P4XGX7_9HYPO|nr:hypothetical protein CFAM422_005883 [Trichoderma lentiforme]